MNTRTMTAEQMQLLSDIFRIIVKEIATDEDKEKLAPGELGISYAEGAFYVRDPYTGNLFSPNSIAHIKQILNNYDEVTGKFNADSVNHIRFYTSTAQLTQIGITLDADTVIRQMVSPSVLYAPIAYENYEQLGFPSEKGVMVVIKINEEYVKASFSDLVHHNEYDGLYNSEKHLLEGWAASGTNTSTDIGETITGGTTVNITYGKQFYDMMVLTVRVNQDILPGAKISVDGTTALPLVDDNYQPLTEIIPANTIIMLVYDEKKRVWIYCDPTTDDVQSIINKILSSRITNVSVLPAAGGYLYTVTKEGVESITVTGFNRNTDLLFVNYGQTILQPMVDYVFDEASNNVIKMANGITLGVGDTIYFHIITFKASIS